MADAPTIPIERTDAPALADSARAAAVEIGTRLQTDVFSPLAELTGRGAAEPRFAKAEADPSLSASRDSRVVAQFYAPGRDTLGRASAVLSPRQADGGATVDVALNTSGLTGANPTDYAKLAEAIPELVDGGAGDKTIVVSGADARTASALLGSGFELPDTVRQKATDVFLGSAAADGSPAQPGCTLEQMTRLLKGSGIDTSDPQTAVWALSETVRQVNRDLAGSVPARLEGTKAALESPVEIRWHDADGNSYLDRSALRFDTSADGKLLLNVAHEGEVDPRQVEIVGSDLALHELWSGNELTAAVDGLDSSSWRDLTVMSGSTRVKVGQAILREAGADRAPLIRKGSGSAAEATAPVEAPTLVAPVVDASDALSDTAGVGPEFGVGAAEASITDPMKVSTGLLSRLKMRHKVAAAVALLGAVYGIGQATGINQEIRQATTSSADVDCKPRSLIQARLGLGTEQNYQGAGDRVEQDCVTGLTPAEGREAMLTGYDELATSGGMNNFRAVDGTGVVVHINEDGNVDAIVIPEEIGYPEGQGRTIIRQALVLATADGLNGPMDEGVNYGPIMPADVDGDGIVEINEVGTVDLRAEVEAAQAEKLKNPFVKVIVDELGLNTK